MTTISKSMWIAITSGALLGAVALAQDAGSATGAKKQEAQSTDGASANNAQGADDSDEAPAPKGALKLRHRKGDGGSAQLPALPKLHPFTSGQDPSADEWNGEIDRWNREMAEWQGQLDKMLQEFMSQQGGPAFTVPAIPGNAFQFTPGSGGVTGSTRMQMSRSADGQTSKLDLSVDESGKVTAKVDREKDGKHDEQTLEADSWDTFKSQYPDVVKEFGIQLGGNGVGSTWVIPNGGRNWTFSNQAHPFNFTIPRTPAQRAVPAVPRARTFNTQPWQGATTTDEGPHLGVHARAIDAEDPLRAQLDLEKDVGLLVVEVVDGSLAQEIGVKPNDIILKVGDHAIRSPEDVRAALEKSGADHPTVTVLRGGKEKTLRGGI